LGFSCSLSRLGLALHFSACALWLFGFMLGVLRRTLPSSRSKRRRPRSSRRLPLPPAARAKARRSSVATFCAAASIPGRVAAWGWATVGGIVAGLGRLGGEGPCVGCALCLGVDCRCVDGPLRASCGWGAPRVVACGAPFGQLGAILQHSCFFFLCRFH